MSLSIFSFAKSEVRPNPVMAAQAGWEESASSAAVLNEPRGQHAPSAMLLDLEHLTPEVIEKFFPSESTLAVSRR